MEIFPEWGIAVAREFYREPYRSSAFAKAMRRPMSEKDFESDQAFSDITRRLGASSIASMTPVLDE